MQTEQVPTEAPASVAPPAAPVGISDPNPRGARSALSLLNIGRGLKLVALLLFLLPWVTVSCADQTLISMSGLDLATGSATAHNPMTGEATRPPGSGEMDLPVVIAALLIAAALVMSFVLRRAQAALASIGALAIAAGLLVYSVLVRLPAKAREGVSEQSGQGMQGIDQAQIAEMIRIKTEIGFWLTLAAIVAAIVVTWMTRRSAPPG
jgi:hypothetical protein